MRLMRYVPVAAFLVVIALIAAITVTPVAADDWYQNINLAGPTSGSVDDTLSYRTLANIAQAITRITRITLRRETCLLEEVRYVVQYQTSCTSTSSVRLHDRAICLSPLPVLQG